MITEDELRALAPEEWQEVWGLVLAEHDRRLLLESAPVDAARLADAYLTARDGEQPPAGTSTAQPDAWPAWVQPQGAHDAYPAEHLVAYEGRVWRSLIDANVWAPGTQGAGPLWEDVTADPEPTEPDNPATGADPDPGVEPSEPYEPPAPSTPAWEAGVPYLAGDEVVYQGVTYRVLQEHESASYWPPDAASSLYARVS
ncbi:carbohydrate-binding protein [uncultured Actinomyces sp.]|jgi:hypothetical protein|uniref:carbohydrate-binding protein n=1 Tax=uncultured Actinomyces sp. TaxID=249061 RepID=UPI00280498BE|nr:carbohydrate-binding protein [uncultured Actinomyces sp.]